MKIRLSNTQGISLVEFLVTSTLGLLLVGTLMGLLSMGRLVWQDAEAKTITVQEARKGLTEIAADLTRSSWRTEAQGGPPDPIVVRGRRLLFTLPASINGSAITWGDRIRYRVAGTGTQLVRENLTTQETRVVANDINRIVFAPSAVDPEAITVTITAEENSLSTRPFQTVLQTSISVRN